MSSKRPSNEVIFGSESKKTKAKNSENSNKCINEELEKEIKSLEISFPINLKEIKKKKTLHKASKNGYVNVVRELLKCRIKVDERNQFESTALHLASENGHASIVKELLTYGANVDLQNRDCCNSYHDGVECKSGTNALHLACENGHLEVVKELLKFDPDLSEGDYNHCTALQLACFGGYLDIVKELLSNGANVNDNHFDDCASELPISIAALEGNCEIFKELMKYGADPFKIQNVTDIDVGKDCAIYAANYNEHFDIVEEALLNGDIDAIHDEGLTKLHHASNLGNVSVAVKLLERGCKVNVSTDENQTALHLAIGCGSYEIVKKLLQYGANVNIQDEFGRTPIHFAVECIGINAGVYTLPFEKQGYDNSMRILETLLKKAIVDIDLSLKDKNGRTAIQLAFDNIKNQYFKKVVRMMIKAACPKPRISDSIYPLKHFL